MCCLTGRCRISTPLLSFFQSSALLLKPALGHPFSADKYFALVLSAIHSLQDFIPRRSLPLIFLELPFGKLRRPLGFAALYKLS